MEIFQKRLLALRNTNGLTYGEREPNLSTLIAFAKLYKVSLDYLAGLSD